MSSFVHLKQIASLGGIMRIKLHGNPGTKDGRSLGGTNSLKTHKDKFGRFIKINNGGVA